MIVDIKKLIHYNSHGEKVDNGYRVVYFYKNHYEIGSYVNKIENFMYDFVDKPEPWDDNVEIPKFVSNEDLLNRYLSIKLEIDAVAIYQLDGTIVVKKERKN